jgi:hypothetical protein
LQWLYTHCVTEQNPFGMEPKVIGFKLHTDAAAFLASLPHVYYLPDDTVFTIEDVMYPVTLPHEFTELNVNRRDNRFMASQMEKRHATTALSLVNDEGLLRDEVWIALEPLLKAAPTVLVFCAHATIATAVSKTLVNRGYLHSLLTGKTPKKEKDLVLDTFRAGHTHCMVGTSTMATGTDGLDKVCDTLIIVDDTDDDALRRQLIGRIMPRGDAAVSSTKQILRLMPVVS